MEVKSSSVGIRVGGIVGKVWFSTCLFSRRYVLRRLIMMIVPERTEKLNSRD